MTAHVTAAEIADLMRRIRALHGHRAADSVERAHVLTLKADLLSRIAAQRAQEHGPGDYTTEALAAAAEARLAAQQAHQHAGEPARQPPVKPARPSTTTEDRDVA